jgi:release factor glutamine methyltransferase
MTEKPDVHADIVRMLKEGKTHFLGIDMFVAQGALVPRAETELLARTALDVLDREHPTGTARVVDMCCGSGNLACAIAMLRPGTKVWASDLTDGAVSVARRNVQNLGLASRVVVAQGDLFEPLSGLGLEGRIDLVVCNPPYISTGKLAKERARLLDHEPREAFDGGPYGVSIFQRVIRDAAGFLRTSGHLMFEIGAGQDRQVTLLFARTGIYEPAATIANAAGSLRVVVARKGECRG